MSSSRLMVRFRLYGPDAEKLIADAEKRGVSVGELAKERYLRAVKKEASDE